MKSIEGVDKMFMSGTRATFTMKEGAKLDEATIKQAIEKRKLKFTSLERRQNKRAVAAYVASTPGRT